MGEWVLNADRQKPAVEQPKPLPPQVTVLNCTFLAVGRQAWGPAMTVKDDRVELANSVIAPADLLKWRYFLQYKTRNWRRAVRTVARILKKGK